MMLGRRPRARWAQRQMEPSKEWTRRRRALSRAPTRLLAPQPSRSALINVHAEHASVFDVVLWCVM